MVQVPTIKLNNGVKIPVLGLGTWKAEPGEVTQAIKNAIDVGYRHFDCAYFYGNEKEIGLAIKEKIQENVVKREDLFITSKLWPTCMRPDLVQVYIRKSLENLGMDYLDLYLIHWPCSLKEGDELVPKRPYDPTKAIFSNVDYVDTWKAMEHVYKQGLTKAIGVSNFNERQLERLLKETNIIPAVNQFECHPYLTQKKLIEYCKSKSIVVTAYSPLYSPGRPWADPNEKLITENNNIVKTALKYKKTPAQVVMRYLIQIGTIPIPKSSNKKRLEENINVFDFELSDEDIGIINELNCNKRAHPFSELIGHPEYPFDENDQSD